jgi:hypothetical protein
MAKIDPAKESQRLTVLYAGMEDQELAKIAADAPLLTELAHNALNAELLRRGMPPLAERIPAETETVKKPDPPKPVMLRRYRDLPEASIAQSILDSGGIESFLADDNLVRMDWFYSNLVGGIKIFVREEDAEAAIKLLDQDVPEKFELENQSLYEQPRCPNCHSFDVSLDGLDKPASYAIMFVSLPIPILRKGWNCQSCGHTWGESDVPAPPNKQS